MVLAGVNHVVVRPALSGDGCPARTQIAVGEQGGCDAYGSETTGRGHEPFEPESVPYPAAGDSPRKKFPTKDVIVELFLDLQILHTFFNILFDWHCEVTVLSHSVEKCICGLSQRFKKGRKKQKVARRKKLQKKRERTCL